MSRLKIAIVATARKFRPGAILSFALNDCRRLVLWTHILMHIALIAASRSLPFYEDNSVSQPS